MTQSMRSLIEAPRGRPLFVGVVHLLATPGAPGFQRGGTPDAIWARARADARALVQGAVDAVLVENFGDQPFFRGAVPPESVAALALGLAVVREEIGGLPLGVNVLRNDARAGLGLCAVTGASFLRVNVHTGAMVTDQGLIEGDAAETLRARGALCPRAVLVADVHVKHATPLGSESLVESARETFARGGADVLVLSGPRTGAAADTEQLNEVREALPEAPLWIGSGLDLANAAEQLPLVDGAIVGTSLKQDGRVDQPIDPARVARLRGAFDRPGA